MLYREALTMGLNQHDQVIRWRLAQKLEFLARDLVALKPSTGAELQAYFKEPFYMLFRMYQPDIEVLNGQYELPGVVRAK